MVLIDRSGSMDDVDCPLGLALQADLPVKGHRSQQSRWQWCQEQTQQLSAKTKEVFKNGIRIVVFSTLSKVYENVRLERIERIFEVNQPLGSTNLAVVATLPEAVSKLRATVFDLIMIGVYFDESRMFELLGTIQKSQMTGTTPVICFSTRDTPVVQKMFTSIEGACRAFGAWMYLDPHKYNCSSSAGNDSELLRIIERCLSGEERKKIQLTRIEIHRQREELLRLRLALESEVWSLELEDQVAEFRERLAEVLLELSELQIENVAQTQKIAESSRQNDRVSSSVIKEESSMDKAEIKVGLQESEQLGKEQEIVPEEESKAKIGRRDLMA